MIYVLLTIYLLFIGLIMYKITHEPYNEDEE
jgi:hypothetical protein